MVSPLLIVGGLIAAVLALKSDKPSSSGRSTADALIDPSELMHPNAAAVRAIILQTMAAGVPAAYENAAIFAETAGMPKTAGHIRTWRGMMQGGGTVAGDEVGASARGAQVPDWLKFAATQSKISGDPRYIRATAQAMKRFGYRRAAEIHLQTADALEQPS